MMPNGYDNERDNAVTCLLYLCSSCSCDVPQGDVMRMVACAVPLPLFEFGVRLLGDGFLLQAIGRTLCIR
jgi:hypothetical protein